MLSLSFGKQAAEDRLLAARAALLAARAALLGEAEEAETAAEAELVGARQRLAELIEAAHTGLAAVRALHPGAVPQAVWEARLQPLKDALQAELGKELAAMDRCAQARRSWIAVLGIGEFALDQRRENQWREKTDLQRRAEEAIIALS